MTQGIQNGLNLALARISYIEQGFSALDSVVNRTMPNNSIENDFQTILNSKQEQKEETKPIQKIDKIELGELSKEIEENKKENVNLKSKIDLASQSTNIDEIIDTISNKYNIDGDFIKAIIKQESGFNPHAKSKKGAMGLMQLMPKTAESLGVVDAFNPNQNIEGGVKYLKGLLDRFDNKEELALAAYNAGPNAVKKYGGIPPYKETQNYVNSIMSTYEKIKGVSL